ncbi:MAG: hypothetical protein LBL47_01225 [Lactobacillus sp.]|nr:hypothetical protein [Lactobacillus sp.]
MEKNIYLNQKNQPVKITARGIASIVTYTSKEGSQTGYSLKPRCIWPNSILEESKYISRRMVAK